MAAARSPLHRTGQPLTGRDRPRRRLAVPALAAASVLLAACGSGGSTPTVTAATSSGTSSSSAPAPTPTKEIKLALVNGSSADTFFLTIQAGAEAEAKKRGVKLDVQAPPKYDYTLQRPLLESVIAQKPDGIILAPDSDTALNASLKTAAEQKIPLVTVNATQANGKDNKDILSFIGDDQLELGKAAADVIGPKLPANASVAIILSVPGSLGTEQRGQGFADQITAKYPGVKILPRQYSNDDRQKAQSITTDLIQANPDLSAIFAVDSLTGQGVTTAIKATDKAGKVLVAGVDADPQQVTGLKDGVITALVAQPAYDFGVKAVDSLLDVIQNGTVLERSVLLPPFVITKENINSDKAKTAVYAES